MVAHVSQIYTNYINVVLYYHETLTLL